MKKSSVVKLLGVILFIALVVCLATFESLHQYLNKEYLQTFIAGFGWLGPIVFILLYAIGITLFIPGTALTFAGSIVFGTLFGYIYILIAAMLGASSAFFVARLLGKGFVDNLMKDKLHGLQKYNDFIEKEGFSAILYLRLVFFPFVPLNFGAGLTKIKFKDYFFGTLIGILPGTFIFVFFFDSVTNITSWTDLLTWRIIVAVLLFVVSFTVPTLVKKWKKVR